MTTISSTASDLAPSAPPLGLRREYNWRVLALLSAAIAAGQVAIVPYSLTMRGTSVDDLAVQVAPMSVTVALGIDVFLGWLLYTAPAVIGLWLAGRTGLGAPLLDEWTRGGRVAGRLRAMLPVAIGAGLAVSVLGIAIPAAIKPLLPPAPAGPVAPAPPAWQGVLASYSAGVTEEVLLRLFVMTLLAWLGRFLLRRRDERPTAAVLWSANLLAALLFGAAHLPAQAAVSALTPVVVIAVIGLNAMGGVVFGWLYATRGLESAMVAHFSADLVVHGLLPAVIS